MESSAKTTAGGQAGLHTMQCMEVWGGNGIIDNGVTMPGVDAWVFARPYKGEQSGGDIHYVSSCGTGRIGRILVADVSGHGHRVSALAVTLRNLMRRYVNYVDQGRFVEVMNREFTAASEAGRFATALVATYFAPTNTLEACNAGHPRPLVYSARKREWYILKEREDEPEAGPTNLPLGIDEEARYKAFSLRLKPGDLVMIYTDSLLEAHAPGGRQLGEEGLLEVAAGTDRSDPATFAKRFVERVIERCGGDEPDDDVTLLVLRPNGLAAPRLSVREAFAAYRKFLGMVLGSFKRGGAPAPWPEFSLANILGPLGDRFQRHIGRDAKDA